MESSGNLAPLPWQRSQWLSLGERRQADRLPHALLLSGPEGMGKRHFAHALAQALLCRSPTAEGIACGQCRTCGLFTAGTHPDFSLIEPEEAGKDVSIGQIRALIARQALKPQESARKILVIAPGEAMNDNAANALLKTLEEPTPGTLLILCSHRPSALLPTIRSRCQGVTFPPRREAAEAVAWLRGQGETRAELLLALSGGAPLAALALAADDLMGPRTALFEALESLASGRLDAPGAAALQLSLPPERTLAWIFGWLADMARLKSGGAPAGIGSPDLTNRLHALAEKVDLRDLLQLLERVEALTRLSRGRLNTQLALEELFLHWQRLFERRA